MSTAPIFSKRDELASFLLGHTLAPAGGGLTTGSHCRCSCGAENWTNAGRDMAQLVARRHLADVVLAFLEERGA